MKRTVVAAFLMLTSALILSASVRQDAVARFTARTVQRTAPARLTFTRVDIAISQWSTAQDQRTLSQMLLHRGPNAFLEALCGYPRLGTLAVAGGGVFTIRYAWEVEDVDGGRRVYLASDEPIALRSGDWRRAPENDFFYFVELRVDRRGDGMGKLSDGVRLSVDESRNVIELRDYERRPLQLVMVHDELFD